MSQRAIGAACTGLGLVGAAWLTKPESYPPLGSTVAKPGLGPFAYYQPEVGATAHLGVNKPRENDPNAQFRVARSDEDYATLDHLPEPNLVKGTSIFRGNLIQYPFNSVSTFSERRAVEKEIVDTLRNTKCGEYFALPGSRSGVADRCLTETEMDELRARGAVFEAPWTPRDLSLDCGRFWPDARGVARTEATTVWVNHEDHLEVHSTDAMEMKAIVALFKDKLKHSEQHGFWTVRINDI